ncbi:hypothetical protein Y032_0017g3363 [Ancylostoma ceylanicum]|uniref:Uncharacterized protein n=1 Tax=Ancylostoma ceylanicum TaxID=53326 RepID=A0A016V459_9BILA|nr:hypothetical protein Y032_0017g3363 [Ancylostoma ceylanicum]
MGLCIIVKEKRRNQATSVHSGRLSTLIYSNLYEVDSVMRGVVVRDTAQVQTDRRERTTRSTNQSRLVTPLFPSR